MKPIFADPGFWIALLHKKDRWHQQALKIYQNLQSQKKKIVTSRHSLLLFSL